MYKVPLTVYLLLNAGAAFTLSSLELEVLSSEEVDANAPAGKYKHI
jgi:hypothetical protein